MGPFSVDRIVGAVILFDDLDYIILWLAVTLIDGSGCAVRAFPPLLRFVGAPEILEYGGIGVEQGRTPRERGVRIELGNMQFVKCRIRLSEIEPSARHCDRQQHLHLNWQRGPRHRTPKFESTVWPAKPALAVHHEGQLIVASRDATVCPELSKRKRKVANRIRRDRQRLANDGDATRSTSSRHRVRVSKRGIRIDQSRDHCEMPGYAIRILLAQRLQLRAGDAVEVFGLHIIGDDRIVVTSPHGLGTERVTILDLLGGATLVAGSGSTLAGVLGAIRIGTSALRAVGRGTDRARGPSVTARASALGPAVVRSLAVGAFPRTFRAISEIRHGFPYDLFVSGEVMGCAR